MDRKHQALIADALRPAKLLLTLLSLGVLAPSGAAQELPRVHIGTRVRLRLHGGHPATVFGSLTELGTDSLTVAGAKPRDRRVLLRSNVDRLEVSLRQESQIARGLALGALVGVAAGGAIALVIVAVTPSCDDPANHGFFCTGGNGASAGKLLGVLALAAAGGAEEGYRWAVKHPRDIWAPAGWPDASGPSRHSPKPEPVIGFSLVRDHPVFRIGLSWSRCRRPETGGVTRRSRVRSTLPA